MLKAALFAVGLSAPASAQVALSVGATPKLELGARHVGAAGVVRVRGRLTDDLGAPLAGATVRLLVPRHRGALQLKSCSEDVNAPGPDSTALTEQDGRFCADISLLRGGTTSPLPATTAEVVAVYDGSEWLSAARASAAPSPRGSLAIEMHPAVETLSLDEPLHRLKLHVTGPLGSGARLRLRLSEGGAEGTSLPNDRLTSQLAEGSLGVDGTTELLVSALALGQPGPAALVAELLLPGGSEPEAVSEWPVLRTATASWNAPEWESAGRAGLVLSLSTARGQVPDGTVIVRAVNPSIGTGDAAWQASAPLIDGRVLLPVDTALAAGDYLEAHFLPGREWWTPPAPLEVQPPLADQLPPPRATSGWWLLSGLPLLALAALALRQPAAKPNPVPSARGRTTPKAPAREPPPAAPEPGAQFGRVVDAHTGSPVAQATVTVVLPAIQAPVVAQETKTDALGVFWVRGERDLPASAELVVNADFYSEARHPLSSLKQSGALAVTRRRRTLLAALARAASAAGLSRGKDATPTEAAAAARQNGDLGAERWYLEVEQAVYGPEPPERALEEALLKGAPDPRRPPR